MGAIVSRATESGLPRAIRAGSRRRRSVALSAATMRGLPAALAEAFEWSVPGVGIGEMVEFDLLDSGDVGAAPDEKAVFEAVFTVRSSEGALHGEA